MPAEQIFLSAVTIGEIQAGVELTREQDPAKAEALEARLDQVAASTNVLAMDAAAFREWARPKRRKPQTLIEDAMIAASATVRKLTVATRNTREFTSLGVASTNPFEAKGGP